MSTLRSRSLKDEIELLASHCPESGLAMNEVLDHLGSQGHAIFALLLALPFIFPIPLPGLSTPFGIIILFIGLALTFDCEPWMPARFHRIKIPYHALQQMSRRIVPWLVRLEKVLRPRWFDFTESRLVRRTHGALIVVAAILLALPAPPGGNVGPGAAITFFCLALIEADGLMSLFGGVALAASFVYFAGLVLAITHWF